MGMDDQKRVIVIAITPGDEALCFLPPLFHSRPMASFGRKWVCNANDKYSVTTFWRTHKSSGKNKTEHLHGSDEGEDLELQPTPTVEPCRNFASSGEH